MAYRVFYREDIDAIRDQLSAVARFIRLVHSLHGDDHHEHVGHPPQMMPIDRSKPYESLERTVELLDHVRAFYPTRAQARQGAYTFYRDPATGAYAYR